MIYDVINSNVIGIIIASMLTFIFTILLNFSINISQNNQKIIDKKLDALENIMDVARKLNNSTRLGMRIPVECYLYPTEDSIPLIESIPSIYTSYAQLEDFLNEFQNTYDRNRLWLSNDLINELDFICDYLANCLDFITGNSDNEVKYMGIVLQDEVTDLYNSLENKMRLTINSKKLRTKASRTYDAAIKIRQNKGIHTILHQKFLIKSDYILSDDFTHCNQCTKSKDCRLHKYFS